MIYFIQDCQTFAIKIGWTKSDAAEERRKALQTGNPSRIVILATTPGDKNVETDLHRMFQEHNIHGEWFRPHPDVMKYIISIQDPKPTKTGTGLVFVCAADIPKRRETVKIAKGYVVIVTEHHRKHYYDYAFDLDRANTPTKLLGWVRHLSEKQWFDGDTCDELIQKVCHHFGWDCWGAD